MLNCGRVLGFKVTCGLIFCGIRTAQKQLPNLVQWREEFQVLKAMLNLSYKIEQYLCWEPKVEPV